MNDRRRSDDLLADTLSGLRDDLREIRTELRMLSDRVVSMEADFGAHASEEAKYRKSMDDLQVWISSTKIGIKFARILFVLAVAILGFFSVSITYSGIKQFIHNLFSE